MDKENKKKQQANTEKKKLTIIVGAIVAVLAIGLAFMAFNNKPANTPAASTSSMASSQASAAPAEAVKEYVFEVTHKDGSTLQKTFTTQREYLDKALLNEGVVAGDEGDYGLFVTEVDGEKADYNVDGGWWKFIVNGEESQVGVSSTPVENGSTYSFVYTMN